MFMKKIICLFVFGVLLIVNTYSVAQSSTNCKTTSTVISGTYQGKNLYFQTTMDNSIQKITLNKKEMPKLFLSSTFELDLSTLMAGDKYEIIIEYCEGKELPYRLLNPETVK